MKSTASGNSCSKSWSGLSSKLYFLYVKPKPCSALYFSTGMRTSSHKLHSCARFKMCVMPVLVVSSFAFSAFWLPPRKSHGRISEECEDMCDSSCSTRTSFSQRTQTTRSRRADSSICEKSTSSICLDSSSSFFLPTASTLLRSSAMPHAPTAGCTTTALAFSGPLAFDGGGGPLAPATLGGGLPLGGGDPLAPTADVGGSVPLGGGLPFGGGDPLGGGRPLAPRVLGGTGPFGGGRPLAFTALGGSWPLSCG
mmetsp:Transcript_135146/g.376521  ORF Transcript_135146/g.376521 Transcript_135146/m.376521 type:complete len:253 (-) Transcript_135146:84-842(-)